MRTLLPLCLLLTGCGGTLFTIHVREASVTEVPAASPLELVLSGLGFGDFVSMDIVSAEELANQGVEPGDVKDVRLDSFELEALDGDLDLAFLDALAIYVEAPDLDPVRVASQDDFPVGEPLVSFSIDDVDLTPYVQSRSLTVTTEVSGRRPEAATRVEARIDLAVGVTGQGVANNL
jgi:hypothetical protein